MDTTTPLNVPLDASAHRFSLACRFCPFSKTRRASRARTQFFHERGGKPPARASRCCCPGATPEDGSVRPSRGKSSVRPSRKATQSGVALPGGSVPSAVQGGLHLQETLKRPKLAVEKNPAHSHGAGAHGPAGVPRSPRCGATTLLT